MTIKNFSLGGVGSSLQFGKGGALIKTDGVALQARLANDGDLTRFKGAPGVELADFVTLAQLNEVASGVRVKEAAVAHLSSVAGLTWVGATVTNQASVSTWGAPGANDGPGKITGAPNVIDSVTLAVNDRVLVSGFTAVDEYKNGIYTVTTLGSGPATVTMVRAVDAGGMGNTAPGATTQNKYNYDNNNVGYGDTVFVSSGTAYGGKTYILTNVHNVDVIPPGMEPYLNKTGTDDGKIRFVLMSASQTYTANAGVELTGTTFRLDIDNMSTGTVALSSNIPFGDGVSGGPDAKTTVANMLSSLNIPNSITTNGMLVKTGASTWASRSLSPGGAGVEGIVITNADGVSGNPVIGFNIEGLTPAGTITATDELVISNGTNNRKVQIDTLLTDRGVARGIVGSGYTFNDAGTFRSGSFSAATGNLTGLAITTTPSTGNTVFGLNINGTVAKTTAALADKLLIWDSVADANKSITVQKIIDLISSNVSDNEISLGNTSVVITDTGTNGTITFTAEGAPVATITAAGLVADHVSDSSLVAGRVVYAGAGGSLSSEAGFEYNAATNTLTVANIAVTGNNYGFTGTNGNVIMSNGSGGHVTDADISFNTTTNALTIGSATITGGANTTIATTATNGNLILDTDGTGSVLVNAKTTITAPSATSATSLFMSGPADGSGGQVNLQYQSGTTRKLALQIDSDLSIRSLVHATSNATSNGAGIAVFNPNNSLSATIATQCGPLATDIPSTTLLSPSTTLVHSDVSSTFEVGTTFTATSVYTKVAQTTSAITLTAATATTDNTIVLDGTNITLNGVNGSVLVDKNPTVAMAVATKQYVDTTVAAAVTPGVIASRKATVSLTSAATTSIGVIPASADAVRVRVIVNTASDVATTVVVSGSAAGVLMTASENDPQQAGIYEVTLHTALIASETISATVATPGATGSAVVLVEYRYN